MDKTTSKPTRLESIDEPRDEEERTLMNPTTWEWDEPAELIAAPDRIATFELSFDRSQLRLVSDAAAAANMPVGRWIKQLALEHAERKRRPQGSAAD